MWPPFPIVKSKLPLLGNWEMRASLLIHTCTCQALYTKANNVSWGRTWIPDSMHWDVETPPLVQVLGKVIRLLGRRLGSAEMRLHMSLFFFFSAWHRTQGFIHIRKAVLSLNYALSFNMPLSKKVYSNIRACQHVVHAKALCWLCIHSLWTRNEAKSVKTYISRLLLC